MTDPSAKDPRARLDAVFAAALIAHAEDLLAQSAQITLHAVPTVAREARRLRVLLDDEEVLDARGAEQTQQRLINELDRIEPELNGLRVRQNALARELQRLLDEAL